MKYLFQGDHVLTLPITIGTSSLPLGGNYKAQVNLQTNSGQNGCVKLSDIHIQSSKWIFLYFVENKYKNNNFYV